MSLKEKLLKSTVACIGLVALISAFSLAAKNDRNRKERESRLPKKHITGIVIGDSFTRTSLDGNRYAFTIDTGTNKFKTFRVFGPNEALDSRINPGYEVKVELNPRDNLDKNEFYISKRQIKYIRRLE